MSKDYAHDETDRILKEMEEKVGDVYRQAQEEMQAKLDDYLRRYEIKNEIWLQKVESGERTLEEYKAWQHGQMIAGYRWEAMKDQLATDLNNSNKVARRIVSGYSAGVYALNHNYAIYQIEKQINAMTTLTMYSTEAVERIIRENPELLPPPTQKTRDMFSRFDRYAAGVVDGITEKEQKAFKQLIADGKDIRWQKGQIQSVATQAVLQGESIPNIAKRIARTMGEVNHKSTIRYARTAMTGVQAAGRQDAYREATDIGIDLERQWVATLDMRTRHEHRFLDGMTAKVDEPFEVYGDEIMFPGDPACPNPALIWNCRCRTIAVVEGFPHDLSRRSTKKLDGMSYDEWKESKVERPQPITRQEEIGESMRRRYIKEYYDGGGKTGRAKDVSQSTAKGSKPTQKPQEQFVRAKTREEAEQYARRFASSVDFKGISVENCNLINETLTKLTSKYPIKTLETIDGKPLRGAVASANFSGLSFSGKKLGAVLSEEQKVFDEIRASTQASIEEMRRRYSGKKRIPPQVQSRIDRMESSIRYDRWCVQASYEDHVACIVTHEYGHVLSDQYFGMINDVKANANYATSMQLREMNAKWNNAYQRAISSGDIYGLSKYGSKNAQEFFAESFVAYEKGEKLPDYIAELFEEVFKNGIM